MKEADIQRVFGKMIKAQPPAHTAVYELKLCKKKSIPFDALQDHQRSALWSANRSYYYHKINDMPIFRGHKTRFANLKPFDCFFLRGVEAYVVILFYKPRKPKEFIFINIKRWEWERLGSSRKSLTEKRAKEICHHTIIYRRSDE